MLPAHFNFLLHNVDENFNAFIALSKILDNLPYSNERKSKGGLGIPCRQSSNIDCYLVYSVDTFMIIQVTCWNISFNLCNI